MPKVPALPFVRGGVSAGLSANQAFRAYQQYAAEETELTGERWTASNRSVFLQMYSSTRASRGQIGEAMNAPKNEPLGGLQPVPRETVRATGKGYWSVILSRPIGSTEVDRLFHLTRSDDALSPAEVEAIARADFEASATDVHGSMFRNVIEGVLFTGVEQFIPTEGI